MTRTRSLPAARGLLLLIMFPSAVPWAHGQKGRSEVEEGNRQFHAQEYEKARESYRKAREQAPRSPVATFNLGNSEYKLDEFSGAEESFLEAIESGSPEVLAQAHYNLANSLFKQGRIEESIEGYKQALRLNPADGEAKHNLEFALKQQQEHEKQQQNQDQSSPEDQEDQDQEDQDKGESGQQPDEQPSENPGNQGESEDQEDDSGERPQGDEGDQQQQDPPAEGQQEQEDGQTDGQSDAGTAPDPAQSQLTKEEAARLLEAIREDLQSLRRQQLKKLKRSRPEKDW